MKNADTAGKKGDDAGQKVGGIKRHLIVDPQGLPHAVAMTTAEITDRTGALLALTTQRENLTEVKAVLADSGCTGKPCATAVQTLLGAAVKIAQRPELHTFAVLPQRWVVERSFAWREKCRRLWKNCARTLTTSLQFIDLAFLALLLRRFCTVP